MAAAAGAAAPWATTRTGEFGACHRIQRVPPHCDTHLPTQCLVTRAHGTVGSRCAHLTARCTHMAHTAAEFAANPSRGPSWRGGGPGASPGFGRGGAPGGTPYVPGSGAAGGARRMSNSGAAPMRKDDKGKGEYDTNGAQAICVIEWGLPPGMWEDCCKVALRGCRALAPAHSAHTAFLQRARRLVRADT